MNTPREPVIYKPRFGFELNTLIPELQTWNDGLGIDVVSWAKAMTNIEILIAYGNLFWPEFVEYDDCVFRDNFKVSAYEGFMEQTHGDKTAVESVMNHLHISDLFYVQKKTEAQMAYVGRLLKDIWRAKPNRDFPNRIIEVQFYENKIDDYADFQITFVQPRTKTPEELQKLVPLT